MYKYITNYSNYKWIKFASSKELSNESIKIQTYAFYVIIPKA